MYDFIRGILSYVKGTEITLDVQGVGYRLFIHPRLLGQLPRLNEETTLFTSHILRENFEGLYGFATRQERHLFEVLVGISGVGPKTALAIIGHLDIATMQQAVLQGDIATLSKVPGIGKKSAERLIVDLKDKLPRLFAHEKEGKETAEKDLFSPLIEDALSALINLGYSQAVAKKALEKVLSDQKEAPPLADLITQSLKNI